MVLTKCVSIRELAQTTGVIVSSFVTVPHGQPWYRELKVVGFSFTTEQITILGKRLTSPAAEQLQWWNNNIMDSVAPIKSPPVDYIIYSDASLEGRNVQT